LPESGGLQTLTTELGFPDHIGIGVNDARSSVDFFGSAFDFGHWVVRGFIRGKEDSLVGEPLSLRIPCINLKDSSFRA
jgi:hypothetical protein